MRSLRKTSDSVDDELDVSVDSVTGHYIALERQGKLRQLLQLQNKRERIAAKLMPVEAELSQFANPIWLLNFYAKTARGGSFESELSRRARQLEHQKLKLKNELVSVEEQISALDRTLLRLPLPATRSAVLPPPIDASQDKFVMVRDYAIVQAALSGLSDLDICRRLDLDLARHDGPPLGFPERWVEELADVARRSGGPSYVSAYQHSATKNRVQKMISSAKKRLLP
jgi:hypothetical protein